MAKRGPKKRVVAPSQGIEPLKSQNIMVGGHRTSMRLERTMWDALEDIGRREALSINRLCTMIKERIEEQARRRGLPLDQLDVTLTSAVRVFIAAYFRRASTEEGHSRAGHGGGEPFIGTPFDLPPLEEPEAPKPEDAASAQPALPAPAAAQGGPPAKMAGLEA